MTNYLNLNLNYINLGSVWYGYVASLPHAPCSLTRTDMGQAQTHAPNSFLSMLALLSVIVRPPPASPAPPPHLPPTWPRCSHSSLRPPWRSRTRWTAPSSALRQFRNQKEVLLIPCLRVRPGKKCPRFVYARGFPWLKKNACR